MTTTAFVAALAAAGATLLAVPARRPRPSGDRPRSGAELRARLGNVVTDAGLDPSPERGLQRWAAAAVAAPAVLATTLGAGSAIVGVLAVLATPPVIARLRRSSRSARRDDQLPEALERIASGLRSGASLGSAVREAAARTPAPLGEELAEVAAAAEGGRRLATVLDQWADRAGTPPVRLAVTALALGSETGGAVARAIDGVAATLRDRRNVAAEAGALATQARASAALIAVAPLGFAALVMSADQDAAGMLLGSPLGLACLAGGLTLDAAGAAWMSRIVRSAR
jgi:tight adherence protein B